MTLNNDPTLREIVTRRLAETGQDHDRAFVAFADHLCGQADTRRLAADLAELARTSAVVTWWAKVWRERTEASPYDDPRAALERANDRALHVLTDQAVPRAVCPFAQGFALAEIEAARAFYHESKQLLANATLREKACTCGTRA